MGFKDRHAYARTARVPVMPMYTDICYRPPRSGEDGRDSAHGKPETCGQAAGSWWGLLVETGVPGVGAGAVELRCWLMV